MVLPVAGLPVLLELLERIKLLVSLDEESHRKSFLR